MQEYSKYVYDGPVMEFDRCVTDRWHGETTAPTEKKAKSNLAYQYKKQHGKVAAVKITLPNNVVKVEEMC